MVNLTMVKQLANKFFIEYPTSNYPELMYKPNRPYNCLLINSHSGYYICIPFRSNIKHKNAYLFKSSQRSKRTPSGLDFTKVVIIPDTTYLDNKPALIDKDEYTEAMLNAEKIADKVTKYIDGYVNHVNKTKILNEKEYNRKYSHTTLAYFHDILMINEVLV